MNRVLLFGTLTQDAVQNTLPSGVIGALLYLEVVKNFGDRQEVSVFEIKAWTKVAEQALVQCKKGMQLIIEGRVKVDSWIAKDSGKQFSKISIVAEQLNFLNEPEADSAPMLHESKRRSEATLSHISPQQEAYNRNVSREFAPSPQKTVDGNLLDSSELPF